MEVLTPKQSREARSILGMSQATVAAKTGLNRSKLSMFENEKLILTDAELAKLRDFYEEHGFGIEDNSLDPRVENIGSQQYKLRLPADNAVNSEYLKLVDGFAVPRGIDQAEVEDRLEAIKQNDSTIISILSAPVDSSFFGDIREIPERAVRLMASNYVHVRALQGMAMLEPESWKSGDVQTNAQVVSDLLDTPI